MKKLIVLALVAAGVGFVLVKRRSERSVAGQGAPDPWVRPAGAAPEESAATEPVQQAPAKITGDPLTDPIEQVEAQAAAVPDPTEVSDPAKPEAPPAS